MQDKKLGGMKPESRKASWLAEQHKREMETSFARKQAPSDDWQPPNTIPGGDDYLALDDGAIALSQTQANWRGCRRSP